MKIFYHYHLSCSHEWLHARVCFTNLQMWASVMLDGGLFQGYGYSGLIQPSFAPGIHVVSYLSLASVHRTSQLDVSVASYFFPASYALHHPDHLIAYRRPHTSSIQHEIYFRVNKVCCVFPVPVSWTLVISLSASRFWVGVSMINQDRGTLTWVYRKWESHILTLRETNHCVNQD